MNFLHLVLLALILGGHSLFGMGLTDQMIHDWHREHGVSRGNFIETSPGCGYWDPGYPQYSEELVKWSAKDLSKGRNGQQKKEVIDFFSSKKFGRTYYHYLKKNNFPVHVLKQNLFVPETYLLQLQGFLSSFFLTRDDLAFFNQIEKVQLFISLNYSSSLKSSRKKSISLAKLVIDSVEDINQVFIFGDRQKVHFAFLTFTSSAGPTEVLKHILSKNPQVCWSRKAGLLPLNMSIQYGYKEGFDELLPCFGSVNVQDSFGQTPAFFAVKFRQPELLKALIKRGADMNIPNNEGKSPLDIALENRDDYVIKILMKWQEGKIKKI